MVRVWLKDTDALAGVNSYATTHGRAMQKYSTRSRTSTLELESDEVDAFKADIAGRYYVVTAERKGGISPIESGKPLPHVPHQSLVDFLIFEEVAAG